jgi:hypothetical protein
MTRLWKPTQPFAILSCTRPSGTTSRHLRRHQLLRRAHEQLTAEARDPRHSLEPPAASQRRGRGAQDLALQCHEVLEREVGEQAARGGVRWRGGPLYEAEREALGSSSCFERVFGNLIVHGANCVGNIRFHINLIISFQKC